jgi:stage II sporulation protein AA (anti-sigma F factor antagonist)
METFTFNNLQILREHLIIKNKNFFILSFNGHINQNNIEDLSDELDSLLPNYVLNLILDLKELEYFNSLGLAFLISIVDNIEKKKGKLGISGENKILQTIIQLLDVSEKIKIFQSREDALENW